MRCAHFGAQHCRLLAAGAGALGKSLTEFLNTATRVDGLLLTRIKGMAARANVQMKVVRQGRTNFHRVATAAGCIDDMVLGMNVSFHNRYLLVLNRARSLTEAYAPATVLESRPGERCQ